MESIVVRARPRHLELLRSLLQLHLHDLGEHRPPGESRVDDQGRLDYGSDVEVYFQDSSCHPYLILVDEQVVGFALVRDDVCRLGPGHSLEEIFVLRAWRGREIARRAATRLCRSIGGHWEFCELVGNEAGQGLARTGLLAAIGESFTEVEIEEDGLRYRCQAADLGVPVYPEVPLAAR